MGDVRHARLYYGGQVFVLALGVALASLVVIYGRYDFPGGATGFTAWSDAMAHGGAISGADVSQRDVGYPLLLVLGGYPFTHSFLGITLINAIFAALLPLLVYQIVGPDHPRLALCAAVTVILTAAPYVFIKLIHHDQAYLFFTMLTLYFGIAFLRGYGTKYLYLMTASGLMTSITRPAGNLLMICVLAFVFAADRRYWRHYLLCITLGIVVTIGYATYRRHIGLDDPRDSYTGRQIFFNPYVNSREFGVHIGPDTGPAMARLASSLRSGLSEHPPGSPLFQAWLDDQGFPDAARHAYFDGRSVDELVARVWTHPHYDFFELLCLFEHDDRVFREAAIEIMIKHPFYVLEYTLRNLVLFFATDGFVHSRFNADEDLGLSHGAPYVGPLSGTAVHAEAIPAPGRDEVSSSPIPIIGLESDPLMRHLYSGWRAVLLAFMPLSAVLFVVGIVGVPFNLRDEWIACWFSAVVAFYNAAIVSAFVDPIGRYHYSVLPQQIVCAAFGALVLQRLVHDKAPTLRRLQPLILGGRRSRPTI